MNATCALHPDRLATAACSGCRRPVCGECLQSMTGRPVCVQCAAAGRTSTPTASPSAIPMNPPSAIPMNAPRSAPPPTYGQAPYAAPPPPPGMPPTMPGAYPQPGAQQPYTPPYPQAMPPGSQAPFPVPPPQAPQQEGLSAYQTPAPHQAPAPYPGQAPYGPQPGGPPQNYGGQYSPAVQTPAPYDDAPTAANYITGIIVGLIAGVIGAFLWSKLTAATGKEYIYVTLILGAAIGFAVRTGTKDANLFTAIISGALGFVTLLLGYYWAMKDLVAQQLGGMAIDIEFSKFLSVLPGLSWALIIGGTAVAIAVGAGWSGNR